MAGTPHTDDFPARWSREGIDLVAGEGLATLIEPVDAAFVRWPELHWLIAVRPWPSFRVRWAGGARTLGPRRGTGISTQAHQRFAARVAGLFEAAAKHVATPESIVRGWLDDPDLLWEKVPKLPDVEPPPRAVGDGAFRSSMPPPEEPVLAVRSAPTSFEAMLQWLASRPERWWRDHPRQIRLTAHHVYVERRDRTLWRIPKVVRERRGEEDAVFVFGRRAELVLPHRAGCPVREALDAVLATQPAYVEPKDPPMASAPKRQRGRRR